MFLKSIKPVFIALAFVLVLASSIRIQQDATSEDTPKAVIIADVNNFRELIRTNSNFLLEFYSPSCPHCAEFAPVYENLAEKIAKELPTIKLGSLDAVANYQIAVKFGIKVVPTLMLFTQNGASAIPYFEDSRDPTKIFAWLQTETNSGGRDGIMLQESEKDSGLLKQPVHLKAPVCDLREEYLRLSKQ